MTNETRTPSPADGCKHRPFVRWFGGVPGVECFDCRERLPDDFTPSDHCGIVEVDPADFDPFAPTAKTAFARGRAYARKVSQRHAKHGARL